MAFAKLSKAEIEQAADEVFAALQRSDRVANRDTRGLSFADIERTAHAVGQRVAAKITADALACAADEQAEVAACPQCQHSTRVTRKKRVLRTLDGPVDYCEPAAHCVVCRRDFFPAASATASR